jgi:hypothetical protein
LKFGTWKVEGCRNKMERILKLIMEWTPEERRKRRHEQEPKNE